MNPQRSIHYIHYQPREAWFRFAHTREFSGAALTKLKFWHLSGANLFSDLYLLLSGCQLSVESKKEDCGFGLGFITIWNWKKS